MTERTAVITVVSSAGCHFCDDAVDALDNFAREFPMHVEHIAADDPRGIALIREHRAAMYPIVLVDGQFFSSGRLPRGKLHALLASRTEVA